MKKYYFVGARSCVLLDGFIFRLGIVSHIGALHKKLGMISKAI